MTDPNERETESHIASDRNRIREWAAAADAHPVRYRGEGGESYDLGIVPESERRESQERMDWDEFFEAMERDDRVVVFHGTDADRSFEVVDRDRAVGRSALADDAVEQSLREGETVTTEVTEATVVERTVVEQADIESELLDRQHVEEKVVDAELLSREVLDCNVTGMEGETGETRDYSMFETGHRTTGGTGLDVEVDVRENWSVTKEMVEQVSVESRVTDVDVVTDDAAESTAVERDVELEDVERTILQSGVLESHDVDTDAIDRKAIESEYGEGDAIVTELMERTTIDEELSIRRRFTGELDEAETVEAETTHREVVEGEMVEADEYEIGDVTPERGERAETGTTASPGEARVTPHQRDKGKKVVDDSGEEVGMVSDVEGGRMYVDPHPSLTDKIRAKLDWGDRDEESYPIDEDRIAEITHDRVRLRVER